MDTFIASFTAIVAVYIAYQQWKTSEREIKKDMFNLRYKSFILPIRDSLNKIGSVVKDDSFNFENLIQQEIMLFDANFSTYRYLINEYDAVELRDCYKKLLRYYYAYHNGKYTQEQFEQKIAYTLQNIDEILYDYLYIENEKCYNLLSVCKRVGSLILKLFTSLKYQRKLISKKRQTDAIKKVEKMAKHYEEFDKTDIDNL